MFRGLSLRVLVVFCALFLGLAFFKSAQAQTNTCAPSRCVPELVVVQQGLADGTTTNAFGCVANINALDDDILGGNVDTVSLIQPLRDIPIVGSLINLSALVLAEDVAADVNRVAHGDAQWTDVAWKLFVEITTTKLGARFSGNTLTYLGQRLTKAGALNNVVFQPVLEAIADSMADNAGGWFRFFASTQAWPYGRLPHCVDTGLMGLLCSDGIVAFLNDYPDAWLYLDTVQVVECGGEWSAIVNTDKLNMRTGPGPNYTKAGTYARGTVVVVSDGNDDGSWLKVRTPDGRQGWMAARFLLGANAPVSAVPPPVPQPVPAPTTRARVLPAATAVPQVEVAFWADRDNIVQGECTTIHWDVKNARSIIFQQAGDYNAAGWADNGLDPQMAFEICPESTGDHTLTVILWDGSEQRYVVTIFVQENAPAPPAPTQVEVNVYADQEWQETGVYVQAGDTIQIEVIGGGWSPWPGQTMDGLGMGWEWPDTTSNNVLTGVPHASLIGWVGNGEWFLVGNGASNIFWNEGPLYLRINDQITGDNSGALDVRIIRIAGE